MNRSTQPLPDQNISATTSHPTRSFGLQRICRYIREPFCGLSHLLGILLSIVGLIVLLVVARGRPSHLIGFGIYGISLILLYTASTLYHSLPGNPERIAQLRRFDYTAIFLLIAGTYTPVCLVPLRGPWGWGMLITEYSLAAIGIAYSLLWKKGPSWPRITVYLLMGWLILIAMGPLQTTLPSTALVWLLAGGLLYTIGTVVWATDRPHLFPGRFSAHDLWHIFVLGGSACHFVLMFAYIASTV